MYKPLGTAITRRGERERNILLQQRPEPTFEPASEAVRPKRVAA